MKCIKHTHYSVNDHSTCCRDDYCIIKIKIIFSCFIRALLFCCFLPTVGYAMKLDETGFIDMSATPTMFGSCAAILSMEAQSHNATTENLSLNGSAVFLQNIEAVKNSLPREYNDFYKRAMPLLQDLQNKKINSRNNSRFSQAVEKCIRLSQMIQK